MVVHCSEIRKIWGVRHWSLVFNRFDYFQVKTADELGGHCRNLCTFNFLDEVFLQSEHFQRVQAISTAPRTVKRFHLGAKTRVIWYGLPVPTCFGFSSLVISKFSLFLPLFCLFLPSSPVLSFSSHAPLFFGILSFFPLFLHVFPIIPFSPRISRHRYADIHAHSLGYPW